MIWQPSSSFLPDTVENVLELGSTLAELALEGLPFDDPTKTTRQPFSTGASLPNSSG